MASADRGSPWPAVASALLGIAVFAITLGGTYIYDDVAIIQTDPRLKDPHQWGKYWTESYNGGVDNLYRPLVSMSFAVEWWLHGDRPWIFHLVNVLLHGGVCACVAELARRLLGTPAAYVAGLLFAGHPVHVEAVANTVGRAELMCALGVLGALVLFLKPMTTSRALAITGCFVLAVLSKEQGMLLPLLLLGLWVFHRPAETDAGIAGAGGDGGDLPVPSRRRQPLLLLALLLCWLLAGYIVFRESILKFWWDRRFLDWTINPMVPTYSHPHGGSLGADRWLMPLDLLGRYTGLLLFPYRLSPDYGARVIGWHIRGADPFLYLGIAAAAGWVVVFATCLIRRAGACAWAALGLGLTYGLISNAVSYIGTNFAERLIYLPSAFFLLLAAAALARLPRVPLVVITTIALVLASARTISYAARWNDKLGFYVSSLEEQPHSIRLYMLAASEYAARGQWDAAERTVAAGREMLPEYWEIWVHSADVAMKRGKFDQAERYLQQAMRINPSPRIEAWMRKVEQLRAAASQPSTAPASRP